LKNTVLDSYAILVFLFQQKGHERVVDLFEKAADADKSVLIASPNWAEVRYMVERKAGLDKWTDVRDKLMGLPIEIISVDQTLAELAGEIKAKQKMSLADCFCAALTKQKRGEIYTGDPEFRCMEGEIKIIWV
jgi:ribonuclease VapC